MKEVAEQFVCNIKEDTYHALQDQLVFWGFRSVYTLADLSLSLSGFEAFLFHHGWAILLLWRIVNAGLDTHKRLRDMKKPEWNTNIKPLLIAEERRSRKLSRIRKFQLLFKSLFK